MSSWLIDERGMRWDTMSRDLPAHLMSSLTGDRLALYAVNNLGFVEIRQLDKSSTHIRLRPAVVKPVALASTLYWLGDHQDQLGRIAISFRDLQWRHMICESFAAAVRALAQCVKARQEDRSRLNSRRRLRPADAPRDGGIGALLGHWSETGGRHQPDRFAFLLRHELRERYFMLGTSPDQDQLMIEDIGRNYRMFDDSWRARARGSRFEDMPDFSYGTWVAHAYFQALRSGEPQVDRIEAILDLAGAGLSRVRYTRVIAPFVTRDRRRLVLSTSAVHELVEHVDGTLEHVGDVG